MRFTVAVDRFFADMRSQGHIGSENTVIRYRAVLDVHGEDVGNRDPSKVGREDVKRTLRRWANPNTQRVNRSVLVSFYRWAMEEGMRKDNPAEQTRRPKKRPVNVYRLTRAEAASMLRAVEDLRERRAIFLGICAGLRRRELLGLRGAHFARPGLIVVTADIGKGGRERPVPVIPSLVEVVDEIRESVAADEYVLPAMRFRDPGRNTVRVALLKRPMSPQALRSLVRGVGERAGVAVPVYPHLMRHAFADHIARYAGVRLAQAMLGHATIATTETYLGAATIDELVAAVAGFSFDEADRTNVLPLREGPESPVEARTGIEPVYTALQAAA